MNLMWGADPAILRVKEAKRAFASKPARTHGMVPSARRAARVLERITGEPVEATTLAGLQRLVDDSVPEGTQLDYKMTSYLPGAVGSRDARDELRKDVTALANAAGGVLVLGVAEQEGLPVRVAGLSENMEQLEGHLSRTLGSRIEPYLGGLEVISVRGDGQRDGCVLVVVPSSPRKPHAVRPMSDQEAMKFARRVGRHTEWLSEAQVADLYWNRFAEARSQHARVQDVSNEARNDLRRRGWLVVALVPDESGHFPVDRSSPATIDRWWKSRERLGLLPHVPVYGTGAPRIGPRQVVVEGTDATGVPIGLYLSLHSEGSAVAAFELDAPGGGDPGLYLDHLVAHVIDALDTVAGFAIELAGCGGFALVQTSLHYPEQPGLSIHAWDPSWANPVQLARTPEHVEDLHTIDLDAVADSPTEKVAAAAVVTAGLAQHFGEPDARYLAPDGTVRVNEFPARDRDHNVIPRARQLGVPTSSALT